MSLGNTALSCLVLLDYGILRFLQYVVDVQSPRTNTLELPADVLEILL